MAELNVTYMGGEPYPAAKVESCARVFAAEVAHLDDLRIIFSSDFEASVREHSENREYRANRDAVQAIAKTLPQDDGSIIVVVNADALHTDMDVERFVAHEGLHVRAKQTGQETGNIRLRSGELGAFADYLAVAGVALEEFRVERTLCERSWWPDTCYRDGVIDALERLRMAFRDAITNRYPHEPVDRCRETSILAFEQMATYLAYLQAEFLGSDCARLPRGFPSHPTWQRFVGSHWEYAVEYLRGVPGLTELLTSPSGIDTPCLVAAVVRSYTTSGAYAKSL